MRNPHAAAARERAASAQVAREITWPLPLRGLFADAKTSEINGAMADVLDNWRSDGLSLEMRDGYTQQSTTQANQRISYEFGASPCYIEIFDSSVSCDSHTFSRSFPNPVSSTEISSNVIMADGAGAIIRYDGTAFVDAAFTTDTGKSASEFTGVFSHHDRVYAWDDSELDFYYGDIGAVTGELVRFPLSRLGNIKGNIKFIASMTINAAHGMNDILVIMTTTGMTVLYEGLNPGDSNDWRLLGRVQTAPPVSQFAIENFGSDLWVLTKRGVVSVRDSVTNGIMALTSSIARPIADLLVKDVAANPDAVGWQMLDRGDGTQVFLNVPTDTGYKQYAFEVETRAWFTSNYPSKWWHSLEGYTEFTSGTGELERVVSEGSDNGDNITATFHTSWVRMPRASSIAYLIPTIVADGELEVKITVLSDHDATDGDIAQAEQTVTIKPDNAGDRVALNEVVGVNVAGRVFQARFEVSGVNVHFENLVAGVV